MWLLELILQGNCSSACTLLDDRCFSLTIEEGALAKRCDSPAGGDYWEWLQAWELM